MVQAGGDCVNVLDESCNRFWAPWVCFFGFVFFLGHRHAATNGRIQAQNGPSLPYCAKTFDSCTKEEAAKMYTHMQRLKPFS